MGGSDIFLLFIYFIAGVVLICSLAMIATGLYNTALCGEEKEPDANEPSSPPRRLVRTVAAKPIPRTLVVIVRPPDNPGDAILVSPYGVIDNAVLYDPEADNLV